MDDQLHHDHPVVRRIYLYLFIVTFLLLFVFVIFYISVNQSLIQLPGGQEEEITEPTSTLQLEEKGSFTLAVRNNDLNQVQLGQTFFVTVLASSEDSSIVGFDALLTYDRDAFTLGQATTSLQSFQLFAKDQDDYQSYTAALSPNATASVFSETEILSIPFTPTQAGKYTFELLSEAGGETTKMVEDATTNVFAPQVSTLQVTVY